MSFEHIAYSTAANNSGGVVTLDTFTPLTLIACSVEAEVLGVSARVNVRYEYCNYTGKDQRVIAAFPLPAFWELISCRVDYAGDSVVGLHCVTLPLGVDVSAAAATSITAMPRLTPDSVVATVAAQRLPWVVGVGSSVLIGATYAVPLGELSSMDEFRMHLPREIFPDAHQPPSSTMEYTSLFTIHWPRKLPEGLTIEVKCKMLVPLAGTVRVLTEPNSRETVAAKVDYCGDSAFHLKYTAPLAPRVRNGYEVVCPIRRTAEPLRFFLEEDNGNDVNEEDKYAIAIAFTPFTSERSDYFVNSELIFVVDAHNSYSSAAMAEAIRVALCGVPDQARVSVVVITEKNDLCLCPEGSTEISKLQVDKLVSTIVGLKPQTANTHTTNLNRAIRAVTSSEPSSLCGCIPQGYVRHVILLSDEGTSSCAVDIIALAASHRQNVCFSVVGLLAAGAAKAPMLCLLAQEGGGVYYDAGDAQELQGKLVQVLSRVAVPTMTDIAFHIKEPEVRLVGGTSLKATPQGSQQFVYCVAPASLKSLVVSVTGRIGPLYLEYMGRADLGELFFTASSEPKNVFSIGMFHLVAMSARVRFLVEERASPMLSEEEAQEIARYNRTFMLPSPLTEMLQMRPSMALEGGVPSRPGAHDSLNAVTARYVPRRWLYARLIQKLSSQRIAEGLVDCRPQKLQQKLMQLQQTDTNGDAPVVAKHFGSNMLEKPLTTKEYIRHVLLDIVDCILASGPCVRRIARLQAADGSFPLNHSLAACLCIPTDKLKGGLPAAQDKEEGVTDEKHEKSVDVGRVWATALVVASIEKYPSDIAVLTHRKAADFVRKNDANGEMMNRAKMVLASA